MADYRESSVEGRVWRRCHRVDIVNDIDNKVVLFHEEDVAQMNGYSFKTPLSYLRKEYAPSNLINVIDPSTGQPTGETVSEDRLYTLLYSAYLQTAKERDEFEDARQSGGTSV